MIYLVNFFKACFYSILLICMVPVLFVGVCLAGDEFTIIKGRKLNEGLNTAGDS